MVPDRKLPWWFYVIGAIVALLFWLSGQASALEPTQIDPREVRDAIDGRLSELWGDIVQNQLLYHAMYGRFYQGIGGTIPADGTETDFIASLKPTDQQEDWLGFWQFGTMPQRLPMALKIDTYETPGGSGFVATVYVWVNDSLYSRIKSVGPVDHNQGWYKVR